jgi:hypothetical protein
MPSLVFIRISFPVSTTGLLEGSGIFLIAQKIGELLLSSQEYPAKSEGKQRE